MKRLGFERLGPHFTLPDAKFLITIGLLVVPYQDELNLKFTGCIRVVRQDLWAKFIVDGGYPKAHMTPDPISDYMGDSISWFRRLGFVLPNSRDTWWKVFDEDSADRSIGEFVYSVENYALPRIRQRVEGSLGGS
jgi:hypothetical protein